MVSDRADQVFFNPFFNLEELFSEDTPSQGLSNIRQYLQSEFFEDQEVVKSYPFPKEECQMEFRDSLLVDILDSSVRKKVFVIFWNQDHCFYNMKDIQDDITKESLKNPWFKEPLKPKKEISFPGTCGEQGTSNNFVNSGACLPKEGILDKAIWRINSLESVIRLPKNKKFG